MILHKVTFGKVSSRKREAAEEAIAGYLTGMLHHGKIVGEYFTCVQQGEHCAYVNLSGIEALDTFYSNGPGLEHLVTLSCLFVQNPKWTILDDEAPLRDTTWEKSPYLYIFTHADEWNSPLRRGDNGWPIPLYRLPGQQIDHEAIYLWQASYNHHVEVWQHSGHLEIPAYRELAEADSELSLEGRELCRQIEVATGVPTYYFLFRYWGRIRGERSRRCPGCGKPWRNPQQTAPPKDFHDFAFMCHPCRLVSHLPDACDEPRRASIGEWRPPARRARNAKA